MARAPGDHHAASLGQKTMTHTIQCPGCGVVLNVPASAAGRKLKCPHCATKFSAPAFGPADSAIAHPSPASSMMPTRKGPGSSGEVPRRRVGSSGSIELPIPTPSKKGSGSTGDFGLPIPTASSQETYELPLLSEDLPSKSQTKSRDASPDDALALFKDEPKTARKPKGAEARAKARRCNCGGVVPIGMSICNICGLDLDTGQRVAPLDVFDDDLPVTTRAEVPPLGVMFVGAFSVMIHLLLAVVCLVAARSQGSGMLCLVVVWIFGIYSSIQFLRRKSIRPLVLSLGLGAAIGMVFLIVLPIWDANVGPAVVAENPENPLSAADPSDNDAPHLKNLADELDMSRITWGIAMLLGYAALSIYLNSPPIKREFTRK